MFGYFSQLQFIYLVFLSENCFPVFFSLSLFQSHRLDHIMTDLQCIKGPCPWMLSLPPPSLWAFLSLSHRGVGGVLSRRGPSIWKDNKLTKLSIHLQLGFPSLNANNGQPFLQLPFRLHPSYQLQICSQACWIHCSEHGEHWQESSPRLSSLVAVQHLVC